MTVSRTTVFFLLIFLTAVVFALYYFVQPPISYESCGLCDGNQYLLLYDFFSGKEAHDVQFPYYSRILIPLTASLLPFDEPVKAFQLLNLVFAIVGTGMIYKLWVRFNLPLLLIVPGLLWLLFHWPGLIRLNAQDPVTVDVPTYAIQTAFILIYLDRKFKYLWLLTPIAVFQRESLNAYIFALILFMLWFERKEAKTIMVHLAGPLIASLVLKYIYTSEFPPLEHNDKTALETVFLNSLSFFVHPFNIVRGLLSLFFAYGCFLLLAAFRFRKSLILHTDYTFFLCMSLVSVALGLTGGGDYTRLAFLGFPFVMTFILLTLNATDYKVLIISFLLSIPLMRIFSVIPDPGKDFSTFAGWYPEFAPPLFVGIWAGYMLFCVVVIYWLNRSIE